MRVAIFIDGSNLYFKLKSLEIKNLLSFHYRGMANLVAQKREIVGVTYYVGVVRAKLDDEYAQKLRFSQIRLFNHLSSKAQNIVVKKGYLMRVAGEKVHEKGVDVQIATDMLIGAYENLYDVAIVVSSDTDLIPAIQKITHLEKKVEYIGFSHQPSYGVMKHVSESRLLNLIDLEPFIVRV
ncbi:MAG: hypothetical protein A3F22_02280 [Candidatus Magasanikbacteria bacterium RIFCSPHIGHO2_12_FULL_41_16]|uniref:NYN domain-containing protein n=1 Tax=Candidatus Magasanikbacteria bacterium RIFCSPLOWO2_01_FULL_40_15 TaxID=1798686 RepID=A0A1F6N0N8_9BACT|nr:MAG: hypothetical protein A3F22_02280 [Candidatus Magasanikbacteria bacterium RIFCSPHIGHO2_12_FULL_41_16]OGH77452.1 MAG: hypothetical protein A2983_01980 [Candidatus Magasanikbacteria bacterium RIFCSPLOWO2_01_FULL_40_15]